MWSWVVGMELVSKQMKDLVSKQIKFLNSIESSEELKWEWNNLMDSICRLIEVLLNPDNPMEI